MEITNQLLLNLSLLLILVFLFQVIAEKRWNHPNSKWFILIFYLLAITVCFTLSIETGQTSRFDLRHLPFIIGSLYNGTEISLILFAFTVGFRAFFGINDGFFACLIAFALLTIICITVHKWFIKQTAKRKMIFSTSLSVFHSIVIIGIMYLFKITTFSTELLISYMVITALGTCIAVYTIEALQKNAFLKYEIVKSEKIHSISNMAASISHEVRNPMTTIRGFLQLLRDPTFEDEKRNEFIEISLHELDRAEKIINSYLAFSKPALKKVETFDINYEINQLTTILEPLANMHGVIIVKNLLSISEMRGDRLLFQQSLFNIMKNCIEAMPEGGTLSIITISTLNEIQITIKDTGIGMTPEQVLKLGEPYFTTKGSMGTGLGMMVAFNIIHSMHGSIKVDSKVGRGTTFKIKFSFNGLENHVPQTHITA